MGKVSNFTTELVEWQLEKAGKRVSVYPGVGWQEIVRIGK